MKSFYSILVALMLLLSQGHAQSLRAEHVAVVYNADSPLSRECAQLYARTRGIPERNMLPLHSSPTLRDIGTEVYVSQIYDPLMKLARARSLQFPASKQLGVYPIYAMLLMPDLPLRITARPAKQGAKAEPWQQTSAASVDSELALLGAGEYPTKGMLRNPYFRREEGIAMSGFRMLPVTRIDAPSAEICRRMIRQPHAVEQSGGLVGWTIVDLGGPYPAGDTWLRSIATMASEAGQPVFLDALRPALVEHYPLPTPAVAYFGWYEGRAQGPFGEQGGGHFRFAPGAVAVHLHSFSATNVRSHTEGWVGALLAKGADVSAGNVWEPFLTGSLHLDVFYARLLAGYSLAEAAGMATPVLSWQGIVMGDPLYRPYASKPQAAVMNLGMSACQSLIKADYAKAAELFARIVRESSDPVVGIRAALCVVQAQLLNKQKEAARLSLERVFELFGDSPHLPAAKRMMQQHFPAAKESK